MSQANQLLYLLIDRSRHSSYDLDDTLYGGERGRLASRVNDLRKRGWKIPNAVKDSVNPKKCWYTLTHFVKTDKSLPIDVRMAEQYRLTVEDVTPKPVENLMTQDNDYVPSWNY